MSTDAPEPFLDADAAQAAVETVTHPADRAAAQDAAHAAHERARLAHDAQTSFARWATLIGAGVFATTMTQTVVLRLPFQNLLKNSLHASREVTASFFALSMLAWYFKPFVGILTDSVPLFGTRRKHYLVLSALAASALYLAVGFVPRTYLALLAVMIAVSCMMVVGSTVVGGLSVEVGQRLRATGRINSARYLVMNACTLIGGPLGGFLAVRAFGLTAVTGAVIALSAVPFALWLVKEPPAAPGNPRAWATMKTQLGVLVRSKTLWAAAGLLLLLYIAPGFVTPLYYYQVDTLKLSQPYIGTLTFLSGGFGILGAFLYGLVCRRMNLRTIFYVAVTVTVTGTLGYLFYHSARSAAFVESEYGMVYTFLEIAILDLSARATPRGSEGLGFALMMSVRNLTQQFADVLGSHLIGRYHITFPHLVWLNAGTTALVLVIIPFLPKLLMESRDA